MANLFERIKNAWNVFKNNNLSKDYSAASWSGYNPYRPKLSRGNERSIVTTVYNRIATDVAAIKIEHVRLDENGNYLETINSGLNECLNVSANIDQTGASFIQDVVLSMFDEGCVALVPTDMSVKPDGNLSVNILRMRTGKITAWYPDRVEVEVYNENTGFRDRLVLPKKIVAIVENPFYSVMNEPNSTLQRLIRKLNLLDAVDEQSSSGKIDLIIQLPYAIKRETQLEMAEKRRKDIETQLVGSKYGIAYIDGTERVTQLNRAADNNLLQQITYLTELLWAQLGLSRTIFDGTADEKTMLNYQNTVLEPILSAICDELKRKFLTKTARTQGQSVIFIKEPFKLVATEQFAELADKFTRNEILTSNEIRSIIGFKPVDDPRADMLLNSNLNQGIEDPSLAEEGMDEEEYYEEDGEYEE